MISIAAAAVSIVALAAGMSIASAKPKATVTLTLLMATTYQQATDIMNKNFERVFPDIHIQTQYTPSAQLEQLIVTQMQAGNAPDLFFSKPGRSRLHGVWPLAEAGRLLDLTGSKWQGRIYPPVKPYVMWKGKVYAWPGLVLPYEGIYNVDLWNQLRLKMPKNFADVLALCKQVTAAGKIPFVQAFGDVTAGNLVGRQRMDEYVYSVDPNWNDKRAKGQVTFSTSPLWRRALQSIVDMKNGGCFQPVPQGTTRAAQYATFARGDAVMAIAASSEIPSFLAGNPSVRIAMFNVPPDNAKNAVVAASTNYVISANAATKYPAQARTYIDFIAREQQSSLFAKVGYGLAPLDAKKGILPDYMKLLRPLVAGGKLSEAYEAEWVDSRIFESAYAGGIIGLFTGQTTVDSILKNMDDLWNAAG